MRRTLLVTVLAVLGFALWLMAQPAGDPLMDGFREVEVPRVGRYGGLYEQKNYIRIVITSAPPHEVCRPSRLRSSEERVNTRKARRRRKVCWTPSIRPNLDRCM